MALTDLGKFQLIYYQLSSADDVRVTVSSTMQETAILPRKLTGDVLVQFVLDYYQVPDTDQRG